MSSEQSLNDILNQLEEAQEEMKEQNQQGVTVDQEGNILDEAVKYTKTFTNKKEAQIVIDTLDSLGMGENYECRIAKGSVVIELTGLNERQLNILQRRINVNTWSRRTVQVANAVTNFVSDVADYTLNGALAPCAGSVANAGITTARVVGTAGIKAGAMVATSLVRNGRAMATEIYNSPEIGECVAELKGCWSDISGHLFGSSGTKASSWNVAS